MTDYLPGSIKHLNTLLGEQLTEGSGGGGSSDFSTAEVTVVFETEATLYVPYYEDDGFRGMDSVILDSGTYNVVLYKGVALTTVINGQMAGTGNIEIHENEGTITGDCTITIS